ncbi:MAG: oligoendopeptidase F [Dehalococcoidales bacterium]|nr:oligoendopeptidase F [Dehalococcoidales bacterium]
MSELKVPERSEITPEHTWNAPSVFPSVEAWEQEFKDVESNLGLLEKAKEQLSSGAAGLLVAMRIIEDIQCRAMKLIVYAHMSFSVNTRDQVAASLYDRAIGLAGTVQGATAFLGPGLLAIGRETLQKWTEQEPRLSVYEHFIDNLFRNSEHLRSAEVEELLGMLASPFSGPDTVYSSLTAADLTFKPAISPDGKELPVTQGTIDALLHNPDREVRRTAWENYADSFLAFKNTLANTLAASIKQNVFEVRAHKHDNTLEASLFTDNVPVGVFHNLIDVFKKNLPAWHKYWRLRRKILGVETLHPYDIWAPLTGSTPRVEYKQAVEYIAEGMAPLGEKYTGILRKGCLSERWVDIYPSRGKAAGAFSSGTYGTSPFICMSYTDDVNSLSTLAHELGHSMHSYLTWQNQPFIYSDYSLFVAEVASNFHQAMVRAHLLKTNPDTGFQVALLEEAMSNFHRYFFIMPTLARFELEVHQRAERGEGLTADSMIDLMTELFAEGYGGEMDIDHDRTGITWATFGHLYADYYVFQYATGISAAHALSNRVLSGVPGAVDDYLKFLGSGGSVYPLDALKIAGVDLTSPQAVEDTFVVLSGYIDRLEELLVG